jgi:hypothetical protein
MVIKRNDGETDEDYMRRLAAGAPSDAASDRAVAFFTMVAKLGAAGGFDEPDLPGWQRRSAFVRGAEHGSWLVGEALGGRSLAEFSPALRTATSTITAFLIGEPDTMIPIPQDDIDAVTTAAATVAERLKSEIEAVKSRT